METAAAGLELSDELRNAISERDKKLRSFEIISKNLLTVEMPL